MGASAAIGRQGDVGDSSRSSTSDMGGSWERHHARQRGRRHCVRFSPGVASVTFDLNESTCTDVKIHPWLSKSIPQVLQRAHSSCSHRKPPWGTLVAKVGYFGVKSA